MAVEPTRGCGYRKCGALYLVGGYRFVACDRLPFPLHVCPTCGGGLKVGRAVTKINARRLFGQHEYCADHWRPCLMCDPPDGPAFVMNVGERYYATPADFIREGHTLGISKRIPAIPKGLELGKTPVYLAHPRACEVQEPVAVQQALAIVEAAETQQPRLLDAEAVQKAPGLFAVFVPQRIETLIRKRDATPEALERLEKRGITPVIVPDDDKDH